MGMKVKYKCYNYKILIYYIINLIAVDAYICIGMNSNESRSIFGVENNDMKIMILKKIFEVYNIVLLFL